jgi:hypothetical protein
MVIRSIIASIAFGYLLGVSYYNFDPTSAEFLFNLVEGATYLNNMYSVIQHYNDPAALGLTLTLSQIETQAQILDAQLLPIYGYAFLAHFVESDYEHLLFLLRFVDYNVDLIYYVLGKVESYSTKCLCLFSILQIKSRTRALFLIKKE